MRNIIFKYGALAGIVSAALMFTTTVLIQKIGYSYAELVGYVCMVLSFLPVFLGVRKYRDNINGGSLNFGTGVAVAIAASLIANLFYVAAWLIIYYKMPDVMDKMFMASVQEMKGAGKTQAEMDAMVKQVQQIKDMYKNPLVNAAITFTEPLPVSLIFSLLTGIILRRKPSAPPSEVVL
jgi:hypothetical protein